MASNAFYLINKPLNFTSFDVVKFLRGKLKIKKIGHTGTLDPLATGLLLVATGDYTKLIPYFEKDTKEYEFEVSFDGKTDSFDLGTSVLYIDEEAKEKARKDITKEKIEELLLEKFTGEISQIPPKYSALKIDGEKAVDMLRKGKDFEIKARACKIHSIKLLDFDYPKAAFIAKVSSGTYIRSIANDLGILLGTGGYITKLKRTKVGELSLDLTQDLETFNESKFLDIKELFNDKEFIKLDEEALAKLNNGILVKGNFPYEKGKELFVYDGNNITNVVLFDGEGLVPKRRIYYDS